MGSDPVDETIKTYKATADWYAKAHADLAPIQRIARAFSTLVPGKRTLDVGCGPGRESRYFSDMGFNVVGIDLAENFLKIARQNAPKAEFLNMDMRRLSFPDQSFDGIWAMASFLHVPKKDGRQTLEGFHRALKPSGVLLIAVKQGKGEKVEEKEHYQGGRKLFVYYREDELRKLFESTGFEVVKSIIEKNETTWLNMFGKKA